MAEPYLPDLSLLGMGGHIASMPDGMPVPPQTAMPRDPLIAGMVADLQKEQAAGGPATDSSKMYQYAILASLLGSAGAGLGQAFRPWVRPPQPIASPQAPQMPITAPAALQALTQTRAARKGY